MSSSMHTIKYAYKFSDKMCEALHVVLCKRIAVFTQTKRLKI